MYWSTSADRIANAILFTTLAVLSASCNPQQLQCMTGDVVHMYIIVLNHDVLEEDVHECQIDSHVYACMQATFIN